MKYYFTKPPVTSFPVGLLFESDVTNWLKRSSVIFMDMVVTGAMNVINIMKHYEVLNLFSLFILYCVEVEYLTKVFYFKQYFLTLSTCKIYVCHFTRI